MAIETAEGRAWARDVKAAWEITPLVEHQKGNPVQVGFELSLYARIRTEIPPGPDGELSHSRRSPRVRIANGGAGWASRAKPRCRV